MKKKFFNVVALSKTTAEIYIYGLIGYADWFEDARDALEFVEEFKKLEAKYDRINIRINSAGGVISEGLPIFNVIRNSEKETHAYIDGIAYSMAAIIALSADTVHAAKNSLILLHNASGWAYGNSADMKETAEYLDKHDSALITSIVDKTGLTEDQVKEKWFDYKDHLLTAAEAKEAKLVDVIEEKEADLPENIKDMTMNEVMKYLDTIDDGEKEDKFFDKLMNRFKNSIQKKTENKTSDNKMEHLKNLIETLGLDPEASFDDVLASVTSLQEAKTTAETALADEKTAKETAVTDLATASTEKEAAVNSLKVVTTALDELGEPVQKVESPTEKVEAVRTLLAAKPGSDSSNAQVDKDKINSENEVDQDLIDNLPHNKEVDANQY